MALTSYSICISFIFFSPLISDENLESKIPNSSFSPPALLGPKAHTQKKKKKKNKKDQNYSQTHIPFSPSPSIFDHHFMFHYANWNLDQYSTRRHMEA